MQNRWKKDTLIPISFFIFFILVSAGAVDRISSQVFSKDFANILIIDILDLRFPKADLTGTHQEHHERHLEIYENIFHVLQEYSLLKLIVKLHSQ